MPRRQVFVETRLRAGLAAVWEATQDAAAHSRWDLRFGRIEDVTPQSGDRARVFRYAIGRGRWSIAGTGTSVGERRRPDGTVTSALRFASPDRLSLIRRGSGWWRYVPDAGGTRFLTGYDYEPGWGRLGAVVDRLVFRRLIGWATAWSFDRLRLWLDDGVPPERALRRGVLDAGARVAAVGLAVRLVRRRPVLAGLLGAAAFLPPAPGAPRAGRCLRRPVDALGRTAPSTLATLPEPA